MLTFPNRVLNQSGYERNAAQRGDALALLQSLPNGCTPLVFFDPQHRDTLDRLAYGNEGARQRRRSKLPAMTGEYIDMCCHEIARVLRPGGYLMLWVDDYQLCEGRYLSLNPVLPSVSLCAWDKGVPGNGYRFRSRGDHLIARQKPLFVGKSRKPRLPAKSTWRDHGIPNRWAEKVSRKGHPHAKPFVLTKLLIGAVTKPGDLVVDPAAGGFTVMHAALALGREFVGCDIAHDPTKAQQAVDYLRDLALREPAQAAE